MTDLKGKTALVTGSTSGIGRATAMALAARGARVLIVGRNEQRAQAVVAEIQSHGGSATFRLTTLADVASARDLAAWAIQAGDGRVDILINNAGVALHGPSASATEAEFDETFALNVKVPFFLVAAFSAGHGGTWLGCHCQHQHHGGEYWVSGLGHVRRQSGRLGTLDEGPGG
jgi:NAD(P)-dependent dehydrogenase (short-subunit alcohol dehydrogenase family)